MKNILSKTCILVFEAEKIKHYITIEIMYVKWYKNDYKILQLHNIEDALDRIPKIFPIAHVTTHYK